MAKAVTSGSWRRNPRPRTFPLDRRLTDAKVRNERGYLSDYDKQAVDQGEGAISTRGAGVGKKEN